MPLPKLGRRKKSTKDLKEEELDSPTLPNISPVPRHLPPLCEARENMITGPRYSQPPTNTDCRANREIGSFFNLNPPAPIMEPPRLEDTVRRLFSEEHFNHILAEQSLFQRLSTFVNKYQPQYVPTLIRYLDMRKAVKAVEYINSITQRMVWTDKSETCMHSQVAAAKMDTGLIKSSVRDLQTLCNEVLPAYITQVLVDTVVDCVARDITGNTVPAIADLVGELAEVYCLTDPSRKDNPIIYASEEFYHTTQYGMSYAINRNCRFLQGPETSRHCVARISQALKEGKESCETILNYRRDGTPFVNLLMTAPLMDDMGNVRYFIGAQVDVTGLVEEGKGIESFRSLIYSDTEAPEYHSSQQDSLLKSIAPSEPLKVLKELSQMFSRDEAEVVRQNVRNSDPLDRPKIDSESSREDDSSTAYQGSKTSMRKGRRIQAEISDHDSSLNRMASQLSINGYDSPTTPNGYSNVPNLPGTYRHYLLVRPYPHLEIIFLSPSLRIPGLLRSNFLQKVGGPGHTLHSLKSAFKDGVSCTAKISWLPKSNSSVEGRPRWIRCTPLLGANNQIGVWMIIVIPVSKPDEFLSQPFTGHQSINRSTSSQSRRASMKSSVRSRSINDIQEDYYDQNFEIPIRTASIMNMRKRVEGQGMVVGVPTWSEVGSYSPISPLSDEERDLYADYLRCPDGPLPMLPRSARDGNQSRTASLTSKSYSHL